jgi:hypothetical protein
MVALGGVAVYLVGLAWFQPSTLGGIGLLVLPVLAWCVMRYISRRVRRLPAVDTTLRNATTGRIVWPDVALSLTVGAAIAVAAAASSLPWWVPHLDQLRQPRPTPLTWGAYDRYLDTAPGQVQANCFVVPVLRTQSLPCLVPAVSW